MTTTSRAFPTYRVIAKSTGEKYDGADTYIAARDYANARFLHERDEHFQVFCDAGAGSEMVYDAFVGERLTFLS